MAVSRDTASPTAGAPDAPVVTDEADTSPRAAEAKLDGKRVRAIPAVITKSGDSATTVELTPKDIAIAGGPSLSRTLKWDGRVDNFTLAVGTGNLQIPADVADFLTGSYPQSFEYINEG